MIRRFSKTGGDLKDFIRGCPSEVLDNIHQISYYIYGHEDEKYVAEWEKTGNIITAIIPSSAIENFSNGLLYRVAEYWKTDPAFPDQKYNLSIKNCLDIWLGDEESTPVDPGDLSQYAKKTWVEENFVESPLKTINGESLLGEGDIITGGLTPEQEELIEEIPDKADISYVDAQISQVESQIPSLDGYATEDWVEGQGYLTEHQDITGKADISYVDSEISRLESEIPDIPPYKNIRNVDGYLYEIEYDTLPELPEFAAYPVAGCSVIHKNGYIGRNYDWNYNEAAVFVVRTAGAEGRYQTLGVAGLDSLTKQIVDSRVNSSSYMTLPYFLQDGINEHRLFAEVNMVPSLGNTGVAGTNTVNDVFMVRYILDHYATVREVLNDIQNGVLGVEIVNEPELEGYELHWMIKDGSQTKILEVIDNQWVVLDGDIMTNFHLYNTTPDENGKFYTPVDAIEGKFATSQGVDEYGSGIERYNILVDLLNDEEEFPNMTQVYFTHAYRTDDNDGWYSDFVGGDISVDTPADDIDFQARMDEYAERFADRTRDGQTWETVHSSTYDFDNMSVWVEIGEGQSNSIFYFNDNVNDTQDAINDLYQISDDLGNYITDVESQIPSLEGYATEDWVESQGYLTEHQDITGKADISYVDSGLADKQDELVSGVNIKTINNQSLLGSGNIVIEGEGVEWGAISGNIQNQTDLIELIPDLTGYATQSWVNSQGFLTEHQSLSGYATTSYVDSEISDVRGDIPSLDGYATQSWVSSQGYLTEHQSLTGYATQSWVNSQGFLTEHQSLSGYATTSYVDTALSTAAGQFEEELNLKASTTYVNSEISHVRSEIPSLTGYATQSWVNSQGYLTQHQDITGKANITYVDSEIARVEGEIPSLTGYALDNAVVHLTGDETIGGRKTFTGNITIANLDIAFSNLNDPDNPEDLGTILDHKQEQLISGTNIKTINNISLLGSDNIVIQTVWGGINGDVEDQQDLTNYLAHNYQPILVSGTNIKTINGTSILGSGNITAGGVGQADTTVSTAEIFNCYTGANKNIVSAQYAHAEGVKTQATGNEAHAEGYNTIAHGLGSHAEGSGTTANGQYSHSEGTGTTATGSAAHAEGSGTTATRNNSHAEGLNTYAERVNSHAEGMYNVHTNDWIHMVGVGSSDSSRKNAHTITDDGKHYIPGIGGYLGTETSLTNVDDLATVIEDMDTDINSKYDKTKVWSGTLEEWDELTTTQQNRYEIALIYD